MALKFLGDNGYGSTSDAISAVEYATMMGAKVSNNSWGGGGYSQALYDAIEQAGIVVGHIFVAAAGNGGPDQIGDNNDISPFYPASYTLDNLISVASITSIGNKSGFSNYGEISVDLGAPGSFIRSTLPVNNYAYWSGTSMATPHVTGVVALVYDEHPGYTYDQVIQIIYDNVKPLASMIGITVTDGIVDAECAVLDCNGGGPGPTPTPTPTPTPDPTDPYECDVSELSKGACDHGPCTGRDRLICSDYGNGYETLCQRVSNAPQGSCCYSNAAGLEVDYTCTYSGQLPSPTPTPTTTPTPTPDPGCTHPKEKGPRCSDGLDNDCDGLIDGADPDCQ